MRVLVLLFFAVVSLWLAEAVYHLRRVFEEIRFGFSYEQGGPQAGPALLFLIAAIVVGFLDLANYIKQRDAAHASAAAAVALSPPTDPKWRCENCDAPNAADMKACWMCGLGRA